jgi:hypothetical protein
MQSEQKATIPELEAQIAEASAQLALLQDAASDADADAQRWQVVFERDPTTEAHAEASVAAQKAKNAHAKVSAFNEGKLTALQGQLFRAKLQELKAGIDAETLKIHEKFEDALAHITAGAELLKEAIGILARQEKPRIAASQAGVHNLVPLSLSTILRSLNERHLARFRGSEAELPMKHAQLVFIDAAGNEQHVRLDLHLPAPHVGRYLW